MKKSLPVFLSLAFLVVSSAPVSAQEVLGLEESLCSGKKGSAYGLCIAGCEAARGKDERNLAARDALNETYRKKTGDDLPCLKGEQIASCGQQVIEVCAILASRFETWSHEYVHTRTSTNCTASGSIQCHYRFNFDGTKSAMVYECDDGYRECRGYDPAIGQSHTALGCEAEDIGIVLLTENGETETVCNTMFL